MIGPAPPHRRTPFLFAQDGAQSSADEAVEYPEPVASEERPSPEPVPITPIRQPPLAPVRLILVDEADRLKVPSLEQLRDLFDRSEAALVLIGMPGIEKRLARYPQLYSRVGFVHAFRPLRVGKTALYEALSPGSASAN